jgi:hypothetical protein
MIPDHLLPQGAVMPFTLKVEFSGPCLYVVDTPEEKDGEKFAARLGVVIPDCRLPGNGNKPSHVDEDEAEPHVGYLRIDLGDVDLRFPRGDLGGTPRYELVHRFTGQVLHFIETPAKGSEQGGGAAGEEGDGQADGTGSDRIEITGLNVPDFSQFAPGLALQDNLFKPDAKILARTVLQGGTITSDTGLEWKFTREFNPQGKEYQGSFPSFITWTRPCTGTGLTVQITSLAGEPEVTIPLTIKEGATIEMKVANLCALNPLEWGEFEKPKTPRVDADFKWLYRLFKDVPTGIHLPAPRLVKAPEDETGDNGCMGATKLGSTG